MEVCEAKPETVELKSDVLNTTVNVRKSYEKLGGSNDLRKIK